MTKPTTILLTVVTIIILGCLWFMKVCGQERTLIYQYDNFSRETYENGKGKLTIEMATPYRIERAGDTLINTSSWGAVKWRISGKENWKAIKIGNGALFRSEYNILSDSSEHDYSGTDFDISIKADTTLANYTVYAK